jgi:hypothetical protein
MRITIEIRRPGWMGSVWLKRARPVVLLLALVFAAPVLAFDRFTDVGPGPHHDDISAIAAAGITQGCNPPTNDQYCPADFVRRDQMGSFLARAAGLGANPPVANADKLDGLDESAFLRGNVLTVTHSTPLAIGASGTATWFTTSIVQPAAQVLTSNVAANVTVTLPATYTSSCAQITVLLAGRDVALGTISGTAGSTVTVPLTEVTNGRSHAAPTVDAAHNVQARVQEVCGGQTVVFESLTLNFILAG